MLNLVLASASPRRRRLMRWLGWPFDVAASDVEDEMGIGDASPEIVAKELALAKARHVAESVREAAAVVMGFDTLVVIDGAVLGKPRDKAEARQMLERLSGRRHEVVTGVAAVRAGTGAHSSFTCTTPVAMRQLSGEELDIWLSGDEVLGCAGAYNIERHLAHVTLDQCFQNVAGLPLCHVYLMLKRECGVTPVRPDEPCNAARRVTCKLAGALFAPAEPA